MSRKKIKIKWMDVFPGVPTCLENDYLYKRLSKLYDLEICDNPDYLICSIRSFEDLDYECIKIAHSIENIVPDFNRYDYVMAFDHLAFGDRYMRLPLYATYDAFDLLKDKESNIPSDDELLNRKFCSFVVTNGGADPMREKFFHELSKYKRVDSGGKFLNNVGGRCENKLEFCRNYKFNIAIENSVCPGYVTEKIMEPLAVNSVPIYYGDPLVENDFSPDCMVRIKGPNDIERAIDEIITLDKNDEAYLKKVKAACLVKPWDFYRLELDKFLTNIFDQEVGEAKRLSNYGHQQNMRIRLRKYIRLGEVVRRTFWEPIWTIRKFVGRIW